MPGVSFRLPAAGPLYDGSVRGRAILPSLVEACICCVVPAAVQIECTPRFLQAKDLHEYLQRRWPGEETHEHPVRIGTQDSVDQINCRRRQLRHRSIGLPGTEALRLFQVFRQT